MGVPLFAKSKASSKGVIRVLGPQEGSQVPHSGLTNLSGWSRMTLGSGQERGQLGVHDRKQVLIPGW